MDFNRINENYKIKDSYTNKLGFKIKSYVPCYYNEDERKYIQNEITKSCLEIYDNLKNNIGSSNLHSDVV